jgi:hypothetical protein
MVKNKNSVLIIFDDEHNISCTHVDGCEHAKNFKSHAGIFQNSCVAHNLLGE